MIRHGDFYWIPILPREIRQKIEGLPKKAWPKELAAEYRRLHAEFTAAKDEFVEWAYRDRHRLMTATAKAVLAYLVRRMNFDTGRCDPSQQTIARELGVGVRTVERAISALVKSGWLCVYRRGLATTNLYRLRVSAARLEAIKEDLEERKALHVEAMDAAQQAPRKTEKIAVSAGIHPSKLADQDPPQMADQDPPQMADKPMNIEPLKIEPLNEFNSIHGKREDRIESRGKRDRKRPAETSAVVIRFPTTTTNRIGDVLLREPAMKPAVGSKEAF